MTEPGSPPPGSTEGADDSSSTLGGSSSAAPRSFQERLIAAFKLESDVYEEVEQDTAAIGQATAVVAIGGLAQGIGNLGTLGLSGLLGGLIGAFVGWLVWTGVVWLIGVKLFKHSSGFEELLRTLGFVAAPQVLYVLGIIPFLGVVAALAVAVMMVIGFVRAVRQALDVETGRAVFVAVVAVVAYLLVGVMLIGALTPGLAS